MSKSVDEISQFACNKAMILYTNLNRERFQVGTLILLLIVLQIKITGVLRARYYTELSINFL